MKSNLCRCALSALLSVALFFSLIPAIGILASSVPDSKAAEAVVGNVTSFAAAKYKIDSKVLARYNKKAKTIKKQIPKAKLFFGSYSWSGLKYKGVTYYIYPDNDFNYAPNNRCYEIETKVKHIIKNYKKSMGPSKLLKKLGVKKGYVGTMAQHGLSAEFKGLAFKYKGKTIMIALTSGGKITKSSRAFICHPDLLKMLIDSDWSNLRPVAVASAGNAATGYSTQNKFTPCSPH